MMFKWSPETIHAHPHVDSLSKPVTCVVRRFDSIKGAINKWTAKDVIPGLQEENQGKCFTQFLQFWKWLCFAMKL